MVFFCRTRFLGGWVFVPEAAPITIDALRSALFSAGFENPSCCVAFSGEKNQIGGSPPGRRRGTTRRGLRARWRRRISRRVFDPPPSLGPRTPRNALAGELAATAREPSHLGGDSGGAARARRRFSVLAARRLLRRFAARSRARHSRRRRRGIRDRVDFVLLRLSGPRPRVTGGPSRRVQSLREEERGPVEPLERVGRRRLRAPRARLARAFLRLEKRARGFNRGRRERRGFGGSSRRFVPESDVFVSFAVVGVRRGERRVFVL